MTLVTLERNLQEQRIQKHEQASQPVGSFVNYIKVGEAFEIAYKINYLSNYIKSAQFNLRYYLQNECTGVEKRDLSGKLVAKLSIEFIGTNPVLVTYYKDIQHTARLSNVLNSIQQIAALVLAVTEVVDEATAEKIENDFMEHIEKTSALTMTSSTKTSLDLIVKGQTLASFSPSTQRVYIERSGTSSPISLFQSLAFLYNADFANEICPLLGVSPSTLNVRKAVRNAYLGRCVEAVCISINTRHWRENKNTRELERLVSVITNPIETWHTAPII